MDMNIDCFAPGVLIKAIKAVLNLLNAQHTVRMMQQCLQQDHLAYRQIDLAAMQHDLTASQIKRRIAMNDQIDCTSRRSLVLNMQARDELFQIKKLL